LAAPVELLTAMTPDRRHLTAEGYKVWDAATTPLFDEISKPNDAGINRVPYRSIGRQTAKTPDPFEFLPFEFLRPL